MSEWVVKKNNTAILEVEIKDKDGKAIPNLSEVTEAKFQVKESKKPDAVKKIEALLGDGVDMNTPSESYVRITLRPSQTSIAVGKYFMGLQLKWDDITIYEVDLTIDGVETDVFRITQDMVEIEE